VIHHDSAFHDRPKGVEDPEVIEWCRDNGRVWITHDKEARKKHDISIKTAHISVLWVHGHPEQFSNWQFFKVIVRVIDEMHRMLKAAHGAMHFRAGIRGRPTPEVIWAEQSRDMPKREKRVKLNRGKYD